MATVSDILAQLTGEERLKAKAEALQSLLISGSYTRGNQTVTITRFTTWTVGGVTVHFVSASIAGPRLHVMLTAEDASGSLPLPPRGEFLFINPPISTDGSVEDIVGAAQRFLYEAVVTYARDHGWGD